jgi:Fur family transcriptional regulator, peroxide stress response regulator
MTASAVPGRPDRRRPEHEALLVEQLARRGLRVTSQRLTTWSTIRTGPDHMSIHAVFERVAEQMPTTTLRTVYESVHLLEQLGLVRLLHLPGGARVEAEPVDHAHAFCERCGRIVNLPALPPRVPPGADFHPRVENDVIFGLCHECFEAPPDSREVDQAT